MTIKSMFRRSLRDERGTFSVEAVLMFPMLVWAFMAMYVFFEGLRESNINLKATYTVADVLSRETEEIDMLYLNNMNAIYGWLARSDDAPQMRVSVVIYNDTTKEHELYWSRGVGGKEDVVEEYVRTNITPHVPIMADRDSAIIVETWVDYTPIMEIPIMPIGLGETEIYNIVVTSPRGPQLRFEGIGDGTGSEHDDGVDDDVDAI